MARRSYWTRRFRYRL